MAKRETQMKPEDRNLLGRLFGKIRYASGLTPTECDHEWYQPAFTVLGVDDGGDNTTCRKCRVYRYPPKAGAAE
jgi:hypothetical protein